MKISQNFDGILIKNLEENTLMRYLVIEWGDNAIAFSFNTQIHTARSGLLLLLLLLLYYAVGCCCRSCCVSILSDTESGSDEHFRIYSFAFQPSLVIVCNIYTKVCLALAVEGDSIWMVVIVQMCVYRIIVSVIMFDWNLLIEICP